MTPTLDERIVARQLGRKPKPFVDVCRRCRYDYPQVILNHPVHGRDTGFDVFPTVYWLTCPLLVRAISRLEAEGQIRMYEERLRSDEQFLAQMKKEHKAAAAARLELVSEVVQQTLQRQQPRQWEALTHTGIAGIRSPEGVKCLHTHFADFVGRGTNPIGQEVEEQLRRRDVAIDGDDECWRYCTVADDGSSADPARLSDRAARLADRAARNGRRP